MRRSKIPMKKVKAAFSDAIRRRDGRCMIRDCEPCGGQLECSHFFTQGSSPGIMFYPPNAYAQCSRHHWNHHNRLECADVYRNRLVEMGKADEIESMTVLRCRYVKYTDELKQKIIRLCDCDRLDELKRLIETELS